VKEAIQSKGITIIHCAPYSPMTNPIETFFSQLKNEYRAIPLRPKTDTEMKGKLDAVLSKFRGYDLSGHFRAVYNLFDCIKGMEDL